MKKFWTVLRVHLPAWVQGFLGAALFALVAFLGYRAMQLWGEFVLMRQTTNYVVACVNSGLCASAQQIEATMQQKQQAAQHPQPPAQGTK